MVRPMGSGAATLIDPSSDCIPRNSGGRYMRCLPLARRLQVAGLVGLLLAPGLLAVTRAHSQNGPGWIRLPGHTPAPGFVARDLGPVPADEPVGLALTLPLRNQQELQILL